MTANKKFKRRVRGRAAKTGESYTAALRHLRSPKGHTMEDNARLVLGQVAAGQLPPEAAYQQLRQFRNQQAIGGPVRRVQLTGRFLNIDIEVDSRMDQVVAEPSPGWTVRQEGEVLAIDGPGFAHTADEQVLDADRRQVHARPLEDCGDCVVRLRVPSGTRLEGEMMAWRIVTPGVKMGTAWVYAEHASIASESDEDDDPYKQALAELAAGAIDVDHAAERLRGIRAAD